MALARFEGIADYLNESKRQVEQRSIVEHLNNKVTGLPFKLVDSKRWLHRQDVVTRLVSCVWYFFWVFNFTNFVNFCENISAKIFDTTHSFHSLTARASMDIPGLKLLNLQVTVSKEIHLK